MISKFEKFVKTQSLTHTVFPTWCCLFVKQLCDFWNVKVSKFETYETTCQIYKFDTKAANATFGKMLLNSDTCKIVASNKHYQAKILHFQRRPYYADT